METNYPSKTVKKGHLYWHLGNERVERITKLHSYGVVEHRHHNLGFQVSMDTHFRLATREEVATYLGR
jgi:hypothetical protein